MKVFLLFFLLLSIPIFSLTYSDEVNSLRNPPPFSAKKNIVEDEVAMVSSGLKRPKKKSLPRGKIINLDKIINKEIEDALEAPPLPKRHQEQKAHFFHKR